MFCRHVEEGANVSGEAGADPRSPEFCQAASLRVCPNSEKPCAELVPAFCKLSNLEIIVSTTTLKFVNCMKLQYGLILGVV